MSAETVVETFEPPTIASRPARPAAGRRNRARELERCERYRALFRHSVVVVCVLSLMLAGVVYLRARATEFQFERAELQERIEMERALKQQLEADVAALSSPERIRAIATAKLGMVEPERVNYIVLGGVDGRKAAGPVMTAARLDGAASSRTQVR